MGVRARFAVKALTWTSGFAVVIAMAIAGGHILVTTIDEWDYPTRLTSGGLSTEGVVIETRHRAGVLDAPAEDDIEISFTTPDGKRHRFWEPGRADIGDRVEVRYDPENPDNASIHSEGQDRINNAGRIIAALLLLVGLPVVFVRFAWGTFHAAKA
ncbi:MAG: DUF3592 domain-containing protein [Spirillospora sp.]